MPPNEGAGIGLTPPIFGAMGGEDTQGKKAGDKPHGPAVEAIVALLAYTAGGMDVFSFLKLHQIFTSAMTGNTALLGLGLGQGHLRAAAYSFTALLGFALGNILAASAGEGADTGPAARRLLLIELAGLALVTLLWGLLAHPLHDARLFVLIVLSSGSMGVQSVIARKINLPGITTVVFTSTLTMIMMEIIRIVLRRADQKDRINTRRQSVAMLVYLLGAVISGVFAAHLSRMMAVPPFVAVVIAMVIAISTPSLNRRTA